MCYYKSNSTTSADKSKPTMLAQTAYVSCPKDMFEYWKENMTKEDVNVNKQNALTFSELFSGSLKMTL